MKTALSIAGTDPSGGAGIQADLKTMTMNGVFAMSAVTALVAQNTQGVKNVVESTPEFLKEQIDCVFDDIRPDAVKIGMVSSIPLIETIADSLEKWQAENIVVDPVMVATSGDRLISEDAVETLKNRLLPLAALTTPNIPEAEILSGMKISSAAEMEEAARVISERYGCSVLLKGGHSINDASDYLYCQNHGRWYRGRRIDNPNTHGTGCTLSSAIAANLAKGFTLEESIDQAKAYLSGALEAMLDLGKGRGPMQHNFCLNGKFSKEKAASLISQRLLNEVRPVWDEYFEHPFVKGIEDGTLDLKKFRQYIIQDFLYLQDYAKVFAIGLAKAKSLETMNLFSWYIDVLIKNEMDIHRGYLAFLNITEQELDEARAELDNLSYTSYMLRIAYEEGEAEIIAAILSCAWSYEWIAGSIIKNNPESVNHPVFGGWVSGYGSLEYAKENRRLIETLDKLCENASEKKIEHLIEIFKNCSLYEKAFWDFSWNFKTE